MKKYKVFYKDDFVAEEVKSMIVLAESENGAWEYFFANYDGFFLRAEFLEWA